MTRYHSNVRKQPIDEVLVRLHNIMPQETKMTLNKKIGSCVAEWLRSIILNLARSTRVGSNPVVGNTNHQPAINSAAHPSEVSK